ncbi:MAG: transcription initiation factor IIB family protein [Halolamina sp.]
MYRARDRVEHERWLDDIQAAADALDVGAKTRSTAESLFLDDVPEAERSKRAAAAAALYAATLIESEQRSQTAVAEVMDTSRLSIQSRWKELLCANGFEPPGW